MDRDQDQELNSLDKTIMPEEIDDSSHNEPETWYKLVGKVDPEEIEERSSQSEDEQILSYGQSLTVEYLSEITNPKSRRKYIRSPTTTPAPKNSAIKVKAQSIIQTHRHLNTSSSRERPPRPSTRLQYHTRRTQIHQSRKS